MWHETNAQNDGVIRRETRFPTNTKELVLSGPHFYVGNPLYKTPKEICTEKGHYDLVDLNYMVNDYLPRTNYVPECIIEKYNEKLPTVSWIEKGDVNAKKVSEYFRLVSRNMLPNANERTLISSIIPKGVTYINTCIGIVFEDLKKMILFSSLSFSILFDFFIKISNKGLLATSLKDFPLILDKKIENELIVRALSLNSLTTHFSEIWEKSFNKKFTKDNWTSENIRLNNEFFNHLTLKWKRSNALRCDYERRQALLEIDVLVSIALGMTLDELVATYKIQFPVMQQYERDTWYDQNGRIVWTNNSQGLKGVGLATRKEWNEVKDSIEGQTVTKTYMDDTQPGGPVERTITYEAPFELADRVEDYKIAWKVFEERLNGK